MSFFVLTIYPYGVYKGDGVIMLKNLKSDNGASYGK